jgi:hypothetical protein
MVTRGLVLGVAVLLALGVVACGSFEIAVSREAVAPPQSEGDDQATGPPTFERIMFARGATSATVEGTAMVGVHPRYVFEAREGQTLRIRVTSTDDAVNYGLTDPDGQPIKRVASEARQGEFELPATGDYVISLAATIDGAAYSVVVDIE